MIGIDDELILEGSVVNGKLDVTVVVETGLYAERISVRRGAVLKLAIVPGSNGLMQSTY